MVGGDLFPLSVPRLLVLGGRGVSGQRLQEGILGPDHAHADVDGVEGGYGPREGEHVGVEGLNRSR